MYFIIKTQLFFLFNDDIWKKSTFHKWKQEREKKELTVIVILQLICLLSDKGKEKKR